MICLIQAPGYCMTENSIEHFLWNPSEFTSNVVFENLCCLWIVFINSTFQVPPTENSQSSWDHTVARGYRFEVKCIYPLGSTAWGTQEFCSCNELAPHLAGIPQCSYQCLFFFSVQEQPSFASSRCTTLRRKSHDSHPYLQKSTAWRFPLCL